MPSLLKIEGLPGRNEIKFEAAALRPALPALRVGESSIALNRLSSWLKVSAAGNPDGNVKIWGGLAQYQFIQANAEQILADPNMPTTTKAVLEGGLQVWTRTASFGTASYDIHRLPNGEVWPGFQRGDAARFREAIIHGDGQVNVGFETATSSFFLTMSEADAKDWGFLDDVGIPVPADQLSKVSFFVSPKAAAGPANAGQIAAQGAVDVFPPPPNYKIGPAAHDMTLSSTAFGLHPDASGFIISPDPDQPFTIGRSPENALVLPNSPGFSGYQAVVYKTATGWAVVDGRWDDQGNYSSSRNGVYVNGQKVNRMMLIGDGDIIQIAESPNGPVPGETLTFREPAGALPATLTRELDLGASWHRKRFQVQSGVAFASFEGNTDKGENQDRVVYAISHRGQLIGIVDGMGGHNDGERQAEIGRQVMQEAWISGKTFEQSLAAANQAMYEDNQRFKSNGGAVFAGFYMSPTAVVEARNVADSEALIMKLPKQAGARPEIVLWTTRPTMRQTMLFRPPLTADGRVQLGYEGMLRLDLQSNRVDEHLGGYPSLEGDQKQHAVQVQLQKGEVYVGLVLGDGVTEQFRDHAEIVDLIYASGARTEAEIRDVVMREALIRCNLARMQRVSEAPMLITHEMFQDAYRQMTFDLYGQASEPPANFEWKYENHWIVNGYVVKGANVPGRGWSPDPSVVAPGKNRLSVDPARGSYPAIVGRFKEDNVSLGVAILRP